MASTPAEAARQADIVISMVADDDAVAALYRGPDGIIAGLRSGAVAVEMSTVLPDTIRSLAPDVRACGAGVLDAPVSGSVSLARSGGLTIMVGGDAADLDRARPVLERLARRVFHLGPLGSGAVMKLAVNTADLRSQRCRFRRTRPRRAQRHRSRASPTTSLRRAPPARPMVGYKRDAFLDPEATPVAFSLALAAKDLSLIQRARRRPRASLPCHRPPINLDVIRAAERSVGEDADFSAVATHLRCRYERGDHR